MKFCRQCAEYVSDHYKECPNCGYAFPEQAAGKSGYFCTRCKRHLLSKFCPLHGTESSVIIKPANPNASSAKTQHHQPKRESSILNAPGKTHFPSIVEKFSPVLSKPATVVEKNQGDSIYPVALCRSNDSLKTQPTTFISEQPVAERQNRDADPNPATKKQPANASTTFPANSGNNRQFGTFSSQQKSSGAIIEGKLSSPVENPNSNLITDTRKKSTERKKSDHRKRGTSTPKSSVPPATGKSFKSKVPGWIYWVGSIAFLIVAVMSLYSFYYPDHVKNLLFSRAEGHFQQGNYEAAFKLYHEYKMRYPGDHVISAVNQRINQIRENENLETQKQIMIYSLMQKAAQCYNKQLFLKPDDDNAMIYIREILLQDPDFVPALALQNRIVDFYFEQAENAFDEDRYDRAVMYYENILAIRPADSKIQADLDRALKLKYVYSMLDDISSSTDARQEVKNFQEEKSRLKNQIRQERQKLRETPQEFGNKQNNSSTSSKSADKKSTGREVLNAQPVTGGFPYLFNPGLSVYNQLFELSKKG